MRRLAAAAVSAALAPAAFAAGASVIVAFVPAALVGCNPSPRAAGPPAGSATAPAPAASSATAACDAVRPKVAQLYRAELRDRDPARIDEAIADNTTMVLNDCLKTPDRTPACVTAATTIRELEACLIPLDDEGTEGDRFAH